jgi:hypothetical protein
LCHVAGGELDQIQFLLGHVSIQTTEHYLGCKQKLRCAVNGQRQHGARAITAEPSNGRITRPFATTRSQRKRH